MKRLPASLFAPFLAVVLLVGAARAEGPWSLGGYAGFSGGSFTDPALGAWVVAHRWVSPVLGVGAEGGYRHWQHDNLIGRMEAASLGDALKYPSLARGGDGLWNASVALRLRAARGASRPHADASFGMYKRSARYGGHSMSRETVFPGYGLGVGFAGVGRFAPGMEFRFDRVGARPRPGWYFTAALGLQMG